MYNLDFTKRALNDIQKIRKSGTNSVRKKLEEFLLELKEHPKTGLGKPEEMKGRPNTYSRELDKKNRLVYRVIDDQVVVLVLQALGHYDDK